MYPDQESSASLIDFYDLNHTFQRRLRYYLRHDFCLPVAYFPGIDNSYVKNLDPGVFWELPHHLDEDLIDLSDSFYQLVYNTLLYGNSEEILLPEYSDLLNSLLNYIHLFQKDNWIENIASIFASKHLNCDKIYALIACHENLRNRKKLELYYSSLISENSPEKKYYLNFRQKRVLRDTDISLPSDRFAYYLCRGQQYIALRYLHSKVLGQLSEKKIYALKLDLYFRNGKYWNFLSVIQKCGFIPYREIAFDLIFAIRKLGLNDFEDEILNQIFPDKYTLPAHIEKFKKLLDAYDPLSEEIILLPRRARFLLVMNEIQASDLLENVNNNFDRIDFFGSRIVNLKVKNFISLNTLYSLAGRNIFIRKFLSLHFDREYRYFQALSFMKGMPVSDAYLRFRRGMNLIKAGRYLDALSDFEWLIRKFPENPKFWLNYGKLLSTMRRDHESDRAIQIAHRIKPVSNREL